MNMEATVTVMRRPYERGSANASPILLDARTGRELPDVVQILTGVRLGRVTIIAMHDGTTSISLWSCARYCDGVSPTISVKRELNDPSDVQPTAMHVSVTDMP